MRRPSRSPLTLSGGSSADFCTSCVPAPTAASPVRRSHMRQGDLRTALALPHPHPEAHAWAHGICSSPLKCTDVQKSVAAASVHHDETKTPIGVEPLHDGGEFRAGGGRCRGATRGCGTECWLRRWRPITFLRRIFIEAPSAGFAVSPPVVRVGHVWRYLRRGPAERVNDFDPFGVGI